ncbi:MAG: bifunctional phosphopantothenoylcysteine decarboxylase/phosphopantothenate--cysteine ligase CoaBC [Candidatus Nanopelagicaceae bacterium]|jgi:phosphopantothenoylcysteine decarboxylase/phosphopantothenate--cysteine ligase
MSFPRGRELVLGVGAGIAAYKSCELLRRLQDHGFLVTVIPTPSSLHFVGKATWEALSHRPVRTELWENVEEVPHIELGRRADLMVIAPATANLISRLAHGNADDLLSAVVLSTAVPIVVVPAMHPEMWSNPATVANVEILRERGFYVMNPDEGRLTGEEVGVGRFPEVSRIIEFIETSYGHRADLIGRRVVITGGGTREPIDPVRYIGNRSSGKQAFSLANEAVRRGAKVTMIMGPNSLPKIEGVEYVDIETALEMDTALRRLKSDFDALIMTAAVADARPVSVEAQKIKKEALGAILLEENPDLLQGVTQMRAPGQVLVGFAAETTSDRNDLITLGNEKLHRKGVDLLFVNDVSGGAVFGEDSTRGFLLNEEGVIGEFPQITKEELARHLMDAIEERLV